VSWRYSALWRGSSPVVQSTASTQGPPAERHNWLKCGGNMRIIAFITEGVQIGKILAHIGVDTKAPRIAPARGRRCGMTVTRRAQRVAGRAPARTGQGRSSPASTRRQARSAHRLVIAQTDRRCMGAVGRPVSVDFPGAAKGLARDASGPGEVQCSWRCRQSAGLDDGRGCDIWARAVGICIPRIEYWEANEVPVTGHVILSLCNRKVAEWLKLRDELLPLIPDNDVDALDNLRVARVWTYSLKRMRKIASDSVAKLWNPP